ncbi:MAG: PQQ-dependent sugar dehydrogenase [Paracoccus sp. (in: a-proteobacteria)]|uniref:PQQ-dependent sugar dehydrogenase n=1 Tax=Paracoccus sp. TaxID=267 RepID=UPI0026E08E57|nr:PQQ-dependent sugar dehydrogenase [Paracoccus sp. (in: a-proteobacteria)]MDO5623042.1 PQQ-dependent sugar dehydrogenase [Paracoccus sp. (in: a-proteobacteria)]
MTERTAKRITRVNTADGTIAPVLEIEDAAYGEDFGQAGVLGLALHPDFGQGSDRIFVVYSYEDPTRTDLTAPEGDVMRHVFLKVARYDWNGEALENPTTILDGLPANSDHVAGRLKFAPDGMLHLTLGDQGHNQLAMACRKNEAQRLPTASEIAVADYAAYVGKSLRFAPDGSIPKDNPELGGVRSHVFTYGHRNPQGIDFAPDGRLYSSEQGPKTDDELNLLQAGGNYGWPDVAGMRDDKAYVWASWANATTPCADLTFSDLEIPDVVPQVAETAFPAPENYHDPIATMFTVENGYDFGDTSICGDLVYICWPTNAPASVQVYAGDAIPVFANSLLIPTLKRGSLYVAALDEDGGVTQPHTR